MARPLHHALVTPEPHHTTQWIKRFDARFWTTNFARPMMAGLTNPAPDALRLDATFYRKQDLAGMIWDSVDGWSHALLGYRTDRDYRRCTLSFRWRSGGVRPLDAVHGPTLTIEGRDAAGAPRTWYVRLWNYATGTPEDATVRLDFGALDGGFLLPGEADPVFAGDIDRLFLSVPGAAFDGSDGDLPAAAEGWVELTHIVADGSGSMLTCGDVVLPENGLSIATGYDDAYNQTPARLVRQIVALGYRGDVVHYVGMSHYFRLEQSAGAWRVSLSGGALNRPCATWHAAFAAELHAAGLGIIWSLSYELFDAHAWDDWKQRALDGTPALTGWQPPSTLLSPAHAAAMGYLAIVLRAFVAIGIAAGQPVKVQVGEPWWWVAHGKDICLYDAAATAALGARSVPIGDVRGPQPPAARAMLDAAGALLAQSTAALFAAAEDAAGGAAVVRHLLLFLPTVVDPAAPEVRRANVPAGWARPAFDVLQLEDYDWVTQGLGARTGPASAEVAARLGYPLAAQDYFAGFVLTAAERVQWDAIVAAAEDAGARGVPRRFIWALPQVARDALVVWEGDDTMRAFDDVTFPVAISREARVVTHFATQIVSAPSGHEQRISEWADARLEYDVGPGVRSLADVRTVQAFFRARRGPARAFRLRDPMDSSSAADDGAPTPFDQPLGVGDGARQTFALNKAYGTPADDAQVRRIRYPANGTVRVAVAGVETQAFAIEPDGIVRLDVPPPAGAAVTAGFRFDVAVRFADERLDLAHVTHGAGEAGSIALIEVRA